MSEMTTGMRWIEENLTVYQKAFLLLILYHNGKHIDKY